MSRLALALAALVMAAPASAQRRSPDRIPDCHRVADRLGLSDAERERMCGSDRSELPPIPGVPRRPEGPGREPQGCVERCQRFDDWGECLYRTKCERDGGCLKETVCDRFDDWGKCLSEAVKTTCRTGGRRPAQASCEARCQRYDDWGKCLFMPSCAWDGECMAKTTCGRFDSWGECKSEDRTLSCPAFGAGRRPVSCTETCQRFDSWDACQFRTRCDVDGGCLRETRCERFDSWDKCLSESTRLLCD